MTFFSFSWMKNGCPIVSYKDGQRLSWRQNSCRCVAHKNRRPALTYLAPTPSFRMQGLLAWFSLIPCWPRRQRRQQRKTKLVFCCCFFLFRFFPFFPISPSLCCCPQTQAKKGQVKQRVSLFLGWKEAIKSFLNPGFNPKFFRVSLSAFILRKGGWRRTVEDMVEFL